LPLHEHPRPVLHGIPGRYRGAAGPGANGFQRLVPGLLDGRWLTFDARHNRPRIGRILIAYGRDAADVAISTSFGSSNLTRFKVVTEELASQNNAAADRVRSLSFA
jgi:transglutaminase-like putative cysteine protease